MVNVWVGGVQMQEGYYLPAGNSPTASDLTQTAPDGGYAYMQDGTTLVLNNYSYECEGYLFDDGVYRDYCSLFSQLGSELTIELVGTNSLINTGETDENSNTYGMGIFTIDDDITVTGGGSLTAEGSYYGIHTDRNATVTSSTLTVTGYDGISIYEAFTVKDSIVSVIGEDDGIDVTYGDCTITDSTITAAGKEDGIDVRRGYLTVADCTITAAGGDEGIDTGDLIVTNSTITTTGYNGIYAKEDFAVADSIISATGENKGIEVDEGDITITNSRVTATATSTDYETNGIFAGADFVVKGSDITVTSANGQATNKKPALSEYTEV